MTTGRMLGDRLGKEFAVYSTPFSNIYVCAKLLLAQYNTLP